MQIKTGGAAFPHITFDQGCDGHGLHFTNPDSPGMTIRQYYKAEIAAGMMANSIKDEQAGEWLLSFTIPEIAAYCGQIADALIAEDEEFKKRGSE